jgi:hypothetical protein
MPDMIIRFTMAAAGGFSRASASEWLEAQPPDIMVWLRE